MSELERLKPDFVAFNKEKMELIKKSICKAASNLEFELFIEHCHRTMLDPFKKEILLIERQTWNSEKQEYEKTLEPMVSVNGLRLIADRSQMCEGQLGPFWCGKDGKWLDVWLDEKPPVAAKFGVLKKGFKEPVWAVARFNAYAGKKRNGDLNKFWKEKGDLMIAKCAEALAYRRAFPGETRGLYVEEEMQSGFDTARDITPDSKEPRQIKEQARQFFGGLKHSDVKIEKGNFAGLRMGELFESELQRMRKGIVDRIEECMDQEIDIPSNLRQGVLMVEEHMLERGFGIEEETLGEGEASKHGGDPGNPVRHDGNQKRQTENEHYANSGYPNPKGLS